MLDTPDITVLIKAPNQKHDDLPVQCRRNWTVEQLKGHLAEHYPTKPSLREQRLIYSGQLLTDNNRLGDVLRRHDDHSTVHTVHLVCAPPADPPAADSSLRRRRPAQPQSQPPQPQVAAQSAPAAAAPAPVPPDAATVAAPAPQPYDLTQWAHMLQNNQHQLMAMQQMYSQYWTQYAQMMQYNPASMPMIWPQPTPVPSADSSHPAATPGVAADPAPAAARGQPQPQPPAAAVANQNVRLNAQGGVMPDDEDEAPGQWDWLDWLHGLSRMAVLFLAVYCYASVSRLVVVLLFGFLAYLYNRGWFHEQRAAAAGPAVQQPLDAQQQQQQQPQQPELEGGDQQAPAPEQESEQELEQEQEQDQDGDFVDHAMQEEDDGERPPLSRPPPLRLAWTFFTSFFASLVPDRME